jgi:hypothetical protein
MDFFQRRENDALRGGEAEEAVGAILDRVPENYTVLHDVPAPFGNIDHVVLRKDGAVFVIETKSTGGWVTERNGQLLINGKAPEKDFTRQTLRNAMHVQNKLAAELGITPWVNAALVFTRAHVSVRGEIGRIRVMNVRSLEKWMATTPGQREVARRAAMKWEKIREVLRSGQFPAIEPGNSRKLVATTNGKSSCAVNHQASNAKTHG